MTEEDMQATNRKQDDARIAQRYLAGQLSPAEQEAYEQQFIRDSEVLQELEATARMKVGLANLRDTGQLDSLLRGAPTTARRTVAVGAIAASVAMIMIAVALWRGVSVPDGGALMGSVSELVDASGKPLVVGATHVLMRTRSAAYDAEVELPVEPRALELRVRPETVAPAYRAALSRIHANGSVVQVAMVDELKAEADGFVALYVDSSQLEPGPYLLVLSGTQDQTSENSTSAFRLKVLGTGAGVDSDTN
jgi:hypothetical protein